MDLQKTKEARRDTPSKQEESSEYRLEAAYGGTSNSKNFPKNDALDRPHDSQSNGASMEVNEGCQRTTVSRDNWSFPTLSCSSDAQNKAHTLSEPIIIPDGLGLDAERLNLLHSAKPLPPVRKETLSELDLPRIVTNINLRMDANFDRDLHFKPDLDGEKGRKKRKEAAEYWKAMEIEISIYAFCASHNLDLSPERNRNCAHQMTFFPRLPAMFQTLQEVLMTLVPERDHPSVTQNLDVSLLMQQIRKGVLDLVGLSTWLAGLLKTHCAPMRDEWADQMVEQISLGFHAQDMGKIVDGLQMLFGILEAMKLDVANHQIRALRVLLIEDTVHFLQDYFGKMLNDSRVENSRNWYLNLRNQELLRLEKDSENDSFWPLAVIFRGLTEILLQFDNNAVRFPETFSRDARRLWRLRIQLRDMINLEICWHFVEIHIRRQNMYLSSPAVTFSNFRSRILSLLEEDDDVYRWLRNANSVALEISRFAYGDDVVSDVVSAIEGRLRWCLSHESDIFRYFRDSIRDKLLNITFAFARKYLYMSPLAICESQQPHQFAYQLPISQRHIELEYIAMRFAHIGVLHWRVWAPILYLRDENSRAAEMDQNSDTSDSKKEMAARLSSG